MDGRIRHLDPDDHKGSIIGTNGRVFHFARHGMVFWNHYARLQVGTRVRFDREGHNVAINVEIDLSQ
jgi:hypothetical protein